MKQGSKMAIYLRIFVLLGFFNFSDMWGTKRHAYCASGTGRHNSQLWYGWKGAKQKTWQKISIVLYVYGPMDVYQTLSRYVIVYYCPLLSIKIYKVLSVYIIVCQSLGSSTIILCIQHCQKRYILSFILLPGWFSKWREPNSRQV